MRNRKVSVRIAPSTSAPLPTCASAAWAHTTDLGAEIHVHLLPSRLRIAHRGAQNKIIDECDEVSSGPDETYAHGRTDHRVGRTKRVQLEPGPWRPRRGAVGRSIDRREYAAMMLTLTTTRTAES
jgi:hypothetical protein